MMGTAGTAASSLWWRLSWQLGLVIVGVIGAVIFGLCVWAATIMSPNIAMEETVAAAIAGAVTHEDGGRLELQETPELIALKDQNRALWYIAATTNGASTSYGTIPVEYAELAHLVSLFQDADVRGSDVSSEVATIDAVETVVGEVRILFGGVADQGSPVLALFARAYPIYASLLAVALPAIFFAVPRIVSRALVRVSEVAERAAQIEPRRHGARLPTEGIPKEVVPLVIAFNEALDRLEGEAKKRQRFLIDAAHELRTPIAIMQTRIDGMPDGPERRRLLADVARLADSAEQLLDFERHNQAEELNDTVDLVDMARTVVADIAPVAIAAGYQISFCSEVGSLERKGNAVALARAVSNLIRNAIDHCEGRGEIGVSISGDGAIAVADQGPGIPAEHQDLVFAPFYRVAPKSQGTGLGLSLVKQIADNHHARVFMKSDQQGTTVTIKL